MKRGTFAVAVLGLLASSTQPAWAFQLGDHATILEQAEYEYNQCFPEDRYDGYQQARLEVADLGEDANLLRKWVQYSHYYNPYKKVNIYFDLKIMKYHRVDSLVRVRELEREMKVFGSIPLVTNAFDDLGHAIHHIQDMASPGHVVPVDHDLSDGFESFSPDSLKASLDQTAPTDCAFFAGPAPSGLSEILRETAILTLDELNEKITITRNGAPFETTWGEAFWTASSDNSFGHYGDLGNVYGTTSFTIGSDSYEVPLAT